MKRKKEMARNIFRIEVNNEAASIVPLAFPIVAGVGTLITLLTLKSNHADINILCGALANLMFVYVILRCSEWIEHQLGSLGINIVQKVMGIVLLSIAIRLFKSHFFIS